MVFKPDHAAGLSPEQRKERLEYLRRKQGNSLETFKSEFETDFHLDEAKAI
jgi:hypothetical protein